MDLPDTVSRGPLRCSHIPRVPEWGKTESQCCISSGEKLGSEPTSPALPVAT